MSASVETAAKRSTGCAQQNPRIHELARMMGRSRCHEADSLVMMPPHETHRFCDFTAGGPRRCAMAGIRPKDIGQVLQTGPRRTWFAHPDSIRIGHFTISSIGTGQRLKHLADRYNRYVPAPGAMFQHGCTRRAEGKTRWWVRLASTRPGQVVELLPLRCRSPDMVARTMPGRQRPSPASCSAYRPAGMLQNVLVVFATKWPYGKSNGVPAE